MTIKLFSKNNCMQCKMAKRFLDANHVAFEEINIDEEPQYIEELKAQGYQSLPVILSDKPAIIGFRPDQLKALAS